LGIKILRMKALITLLFLLLSGLTFSQRFYDGSGRNIGRERKAIGDFACLLNAVIGLKAR